MMTQRYSASLSHSLTPSPARIPISTSTPALLVTLLIVFFMSANGRAEDDCSPVRLDETSMKSMPVYSQNDIGDCYAVTAAQLVDAYRFSHGDTNTSRLTSYRAMSVKYVSTREKSRVRLKKELAHFTGKPEDRGWKKKRVARDLQLTPPRMLKKESFASNFSDFGDTGWAIVVNHNDDDHFVSCSHEIVTKYFNDNKGFEEIFNLWTSSLEAEKNQPLCETEKLKMSELRQIVEAVKKEGNTVDFFDGAMKKICEKNSLELKIPKPTSFSMTVNSNEVIRAHDLHRRAKFTANLTDAVNIVLSLKNPQPIGIYYASDFLTDKAAPANREDHASVIIGRRKNKAGKCEFLLRNSWGENCDLTVECDPKKKGQYWIDADELMSRTFGLEMLLDEESHKTFKEKYEAF